jgi:hypothetical protein
MKIGWHIYAGAGVVLLLIVAVLFLLFSGDDSTADASLSLSPDTLSIESDSVSDLVTVSVTKKDDASDPVEYTIRLASPNDDMLSFVLDNTTINAIKTGLFYRDGDRLSYVFSVRGEKPLGSDSVRFTADISLVHNDSVVDSVALPVMVE